jgi:hypothetical protein
MNSPYRVHPTLPFAPLRAGGAEQSHSPSHTGAGAKPQPGRLEMLLRVEGDLRKQPTWAATIFHALNETQSLCGFTQGFFMRSNNRNRFCCEAVSGVATVDARAPFIAALNAAVNRLGDVSQQQTFHFGGAMAAQTVANPFALWLPLADAKGKIFAGFLLLRETAWVDDEQLISGRVTAAYGHALRVHRPPQLLRMLSLPRWAMFGIPFVAALLTFVPVPMSTLAPFEVVPLQPFPVTAPIDGVIAEIAVEPNTQVTQGDAVLSYEKTELTSQAAIAAQKVVVAEARLATARNGAFGDKDFKRSITTLEKEVELAHAEHALVVGRLALTDVKAGQSGVLIYASKSDWTGRPVRVGERVMEIADPTRVGVRMDVGVHDAMALNGAVRVRLFFDADPLNPRAAEVYEKSFHATERTQGHMSYAVKARMTDVGDAPRIGLRGTAQLLGEDVSLGFYVLRRPISAVRQYLGI